MILTMSTFAPFKKQRSEDNSDNSTGSGIVCIPGLPGVSMMDVGGSNSSGPGFSMLELNRSNSSNIGGNSSRPGSSTMDLGGGNSSVPGFSMLELNRSNSSNIVGNSSGPGFSMLELNRSNSSNLGGSYSTFPRNSSSLDVQEGQLPGAELMCESTQTLPNSHRPRLLPGMSVVEGECRSAPVQMDHCPISFNFPNSNLSMPGASLVNVNRTHSRTSMTSMTSTASEDPAPVHRSLQPGLSVISKASSDSYSHLNLESPNMIEQETTPPDSLASPTATNHQQDTTSSASQVNTSNTNLSATTKSGKTGLGGKQKCIIT